MPDAYADPTSPRRRSVIDEVSPFDGVQVLSDAVNASQSAATRLIGPQVMTQIAAKSPAAAILGKAAVPLQVIGMGKEAIDIARNPDEVLGENRSQLERGNLGERAYVGAANPLASIMNFTNDALEPLSRASRDGAMASYMSRPSVDGARGAEKIDPFRAAPNMQPAPAPLGDVVRPMPVPAPAHLSPQPMPQRRLTPQTRPVPNGTPRFRVTANAPDAFGV